MAGAVEAGGIGMTPERREELRRRANALIEDLLTQNICLSEPECQVLQNTFIDAFMHVEQEIWKKVASKLAECLIMGNASIEDQICRHLFWCRHQAKEVE